MTVWATDPCKKSRGLSWKARLEMFSAKDRTGLGQSAVLDRRQCWTDNDTMQVSESKEQGRKLLSL